MTRPATPVPRAVVRSRTRATRTRRTRPRNRSRSPITRCGRKPSGRRRTTSTRGRATDRQQHGSRRSPIMGPARRRLQQTQHAGDLPWPRPACRRRRSGHPGAPSAPSGRLGGSAARRGRAGRTHQRQPSKASTPPPITGPEPLTIVTTASSAPKIRVRSGSGPPRGHDAVDEHRHGARPDALHDPAAEQRLERRCDADQDRPGRHQPYARDQGGPKTDEVGDPPRTPRSTPRSTARTPRRSTPRR